MRNHLWVAVVVVLAGVSCNLPAAQGTRTPTTIPVLDTPTSGTPVATPTYITTPLEIDLPTIAPTSTSSILLASPKDQPVNCRFGPATSYAVTGALLPGKQAELIGRNADATWWYVRNPSDPSRSCWLSADFVETVGNIELLPVVNSPDILVTGIQVSLDPPVINIACGAFPQVVTIGAQITTNGPTIVTWHWQSSIGVVSQDKQVVFEAADTKMVRDYYQVSAVNDYRVQVQTTLPNSMTGEASFKVVCTP